ncbi:ABC transporter permease [Caldinitratiruptor microaerophilus]|uniref:ABC transporter permease n=1 Tax=Caldinitratiruptor microaerophilus TaxID=671077 RepID=A0AA35CNY1_9FIRM|nr:ABC transporter permease [Caldinitratiruptor microaerophilus]BDG60851.1 hypothetical protein caldi_19410 [Caldinitratiruptor microaerophilus]
MKRWLLETWYGIRDGVGPLVGKELRARSRGWRPVAVVSAFLLALAAGVTGFLWLLSRSGWSGPNVGQQVFSALAIGYVLLLAFLTPALSVSSISGERERRTLDLLLVTRASPLGIALGKLAASVVYVLYLLLASLPAFAVVYLFGGVPLSMIGVVLAAAGFTALGYAALGQLLSALFRTTQRASVVAYFLTFVLVLGTPLLGVITRSVREARPDGPPEMGTPPVYTYTSPLAALTTVASPVNVPVPVLGGLLNELFRYGYGAVPVKYAFGVVRGTPYPAVASTRSFGLIGSARVAYVVAPPGGPGEVPKMREAWAPWVYHFAFSLLLMAASVVASAIRLGAGQGRWRLGRRARARSRPLEARA